jgi:ABC-type sugar transport system permease subunit
LRELSVKTAWHALRRSPPVAMIDLRQAENGMTGGRSSFARHAIPWLFLSPCLIVIAIFVYWPILYSVWLSLHDVNLLSGRMRFVGFDKYLDLAEDRTFHNTVWVTTSFVLISVPIRLALALLLAQMLVQETPLRRLLRGVFFLPYVSSTAAIAIVWSWMFQTDVGLVNKLTALVGIPKINWLYDSTTALWSVAVVNAWKQLGYDMVLFIAGMQAINPAIYEAARIDGAGRLKTFWTVTVPLLTPTILFLLVISVIDTFQIFTLVNVMTQGGPALSTDVIVNYFYRMGFIRLDYGTASAVVVSLFLLLLFLTLLKFWVAQGRVNYDVD